jgi:hypothetical protein
VQTDELIRKLVADARPVRRLSPWSLRAALWLLVALVSAAIVVLWFGARRDLASVVSTPAFAFEELMLLAITVTAAAGALLLSVPGEERSALVRWLPVTAAVAVLFWVGGELVFAAATGGATGRFGPAWHCVGRTISVGLVPGVVLLLMVRGAAPLRAAWAGLLALLATSAVGVLGTNIICPNDRPLHVLLWHVLPMTVIAAAGGALGGWLLRWTRGPIGRSE